MSLIRYLNRFDNEIIIAFHKKDYEKVIKLYLKNIEMVDMVVLSGYIFYSYFYLGRYNEMIDFYENDAEVDYIAIKTKKDFYNILFNQLMLKNKYHEILEADFEDKDLFCFKIASMLLADDGYSLGIDNGGEGYGQNDNINDIDYESYLNLLNYFIKKSSDIMLKIEEAEYKGNNSNKLCGQLNRNIGIIEDLMTFDKQLKVAYENMLFDLNESSEDYSELLNLVNAHKVLSSRYFIIKKDFDTALEILQDKEIKESRHFDFIEYKILKLKNREIKSKLFNLYNSLATLKKIPFNAKKLKLNLSYKDTLDIFENGIKLTNVSNIKDITKGKIFYDRLLENDLAYKWNELKEKNRICESINYIATFKESSDFLDDGCQIIFKKEFFENNINHLFKIKEQFICKVQNIDNEELAPHIENVRIIFKTIIENLKDDEENHIIVDLINKIFSTVAYLFKSFENDEYIIMQNLSPSYAKVMIDDLDDPCLYTNLKNEIKPEYIEKIILGPKIKNKQNKAMYFYHLGIENVEIVK